jgi:hypothetical protein
MKKVSQIALDFALSITLLVFLKIFILFLVILCKLCVVLGGNYF